MYRYICISFAKKGFFSSILEILMLAMIVIMMKSNDTRKFHVLEVKTIEDNVLFSIVLPRYNHKYNQV
jgi:hypothetical protein